MKTIAEVNAVSRCNLIKRLQERPKKRIGRQSCRTTVAEIKVVIAELPTYAISDPMDATCPSGHPGL